MNFERDLREKEKKLYFRLSGKDDARPDNREGTRD